MFKVPINWFGPNLYQKASATAGNRTRIHCLEGNDANHYTTDACDRQILLINMKQHTGFLTGWSVNNISESEVSDFTQLFKIGNPRNEDQRRVWQVYNRQRRFRFSSGFNFSCGKEWQNLTRIHNSDAKIEKWTVQFYLSPVSVSWAYHLAYLFAIFIRFCTYGIDVTLIQRSGCRKICLKFSFYGCLPRFKAYIQAKILKLWINFISRVKALPPRSSDKKQKDTKLWYMALLQSNQLYDW